MARLWLIRGGARGERESAALDQDKVFLGFTKVDDLSKFSTRADILSHLEEVLPDEKRLALASYKGQLYRFAHEIEIDDYVVMPRKFAKVIAIGMVKGDYQFDEDHNFLKHWRAVEWQNTSIPRDVFEQDILYSFGAFMTICEIKRNKALERVVRVLGTGQDPGPLLGMQGQVSTHPQVSDESEDEFEGGIYDIEELSNDQITALIKSGFAGHELADLVEEIMIAKGYKTKKSPPGPDGGVDILATGGTLGLGKDRICVQVKSGDKQANKDVVMHLIGAVSNSKAQTGLLVSIGGANRDAEKLLDANFFKLRLWRLPELLDALFQTYQDLPVGIRSKLPLQQIWVPVPVNDSPS